ncbi:LmbU family transcriptional regulator [Streptomyces sp. RS10V-4]|uniref:LmbU family transcriptional regulator n=1 Tax=Streptomyces rhizoryzae TaxID=2932493 RepID=UPI002004557A|nr:LmbU family transcriptional regulator [Streptomyces rhizoryzae]MCK7624223.1 LmbU family transcriptional regulator [Streptomyces rhizoryzae]
MGEWQVRARPRTDLPAVTTPAGKLSKAAEKATARRTTLELPSGITLNDWQRIGKQLYVAADSSAWWLGDWLIYGRSAYPDRYQRAVEETQLDYQTLRNYAWVARRFSPLRRRSALSFQHHAELASLPESEQEYWLDRAERLGWSRNFLRSRLKAARQGALDEAAARDTDGISMRIQVNVSRDRRRRWAQAAADADQDLQGWAMSILDYAAAAVLEE